MSDLMHLPCVEPQSYRGQAKAMPGRLRELGDRYLEALETARQVSAEIEQDVVAAQAAGHSLAQIGEASGLTESQLEYILVAVDCQRRSPAL